MYYCAIVFFSVCAIFWLSNTSVVLLFSRSVVSDSLRPNGLQPARLLCPWDFPGKNTGVGCHFLLQGIFLTQGSNLHLWHLLLSWWILYHCTTWEASFKLLEHSLYHCILVGSLNFVDPHMKGRNGGYRNKL